MCVGLYFGSTVQKYEGILKERIWEQQWMGKVSRNNDLNLSLVLTHSYCMASEDLKYSTFGAWQPVVAKCHLMEKISLIILLNIFFCILQKSYVF